MFWFGKRKENDEEAAKDEESAENLKEETAETENTPEMQENEISDETDEENSETEENEYDFESAEENNEEESKSEEININDLPDITEKPKSIDELTDFINDRKAGSMQFMKAETKEVFEIRESHIRMANVFGVVSMSRECSETEYAKVMMAMDLIKNPEKYYVLPGLTEKQVKELVKKFCKEKYNINGRKYLSDLASFSKMVKEQGDINEWKSWTKEAVFDKVEEFCKDKCIEF